MPRTSRRKSQLHGARACRRSSMQTSDSSCTSDDEYRMVVDDEESNFKEKLLLTDIGDLAEMCKTKCDTKYLSTLLYTVAVKIVRPPNENFFLLRWLREERN